MAKGSQHSTIRAISHRIARSLSGSAPISSATVADRGGIGLDLPGLGAHCSAFGFEIGKDRGFPLALASKRLAGFALALDRRERGVRLAALRGFLDRHVHLVQPS